MPSQTTDGAGLVLKSFLTGRTTGCLKGRTRVMTPMTANNHPKCDGHLIEKADAVESFEVQQAVDRNVQQEP